MSSAWAAGPAAAAAAVTAWPGIPVTVTVRLGPSSPAGVYFPEHGGLLPLPAARRHAGRRARRVAEKPPPGERAPATQAAPRGPVVPPTHGRPGDRPPAPEGRKPPFAPPGP